MCENARNIDHTGLRTFLTICVQAAYSTARPCLLTLRAQIALYVVRNEYTPISTKLISLVNSFFKKKLVIIHM